MPASCMAIALNTLIVSSEINFVEASTRETITLAQTFQLPTHTQ